MKTTLQLLVLLFSTFAFSQTIGIVSFATGFNNPIEIAHAGDSRLFIVEQSGVIKVLNSNGTTNATPFLNISSLVSCCGERGLLGLAFHPNYATNGFFYVNYTNTSGNTVISRYSVSSNPDVANTTGTILMTVNQPFSNHNGGTIKFGPDGYLYIGMGDGGSGGDPGNRAQNINELLGKMLRIDVNSGSPYGIPPTNPYAGATAGADEIWAIGLRNPWKFSFNRLNGDLWIADVGQDQIEEINKVSSTTAGLNYGWRCYEGNATYNTTGCAAMSTMTFPIAQYTHASTGGCSITGGYVYTGSTYPAMQNKYFFADYCVNRIGMVDTSGNITYSANFPGSNSFTSFGENSSGELFVTGTSQDIVYRVIDTALGNDDFTKNGFSMYPNPADSELFLSNSNGTVLQKISIVDLSGKLLIDQKLENTPVNTINISSLQTGIYVVTIEDTSGNTFTSKLGKK
ncbi:PQQ-dependent sugar dehydrogenase [Flavobacterium microcysteis]|uniref:T9SS type A sorting domain-containing protein n=1 Tax=Flavobacterium microcysteis TaxID=2596891 RepID=A0A501Q981_9FLAO|nr:PQQ-dependent sugar dehydrogenase [Flavobacterium microcysteis]TPD68586.1 T9SS type A sorting domain-containing protein [Flavobacterium microcysteis]